MSEILKGRQVETREIYMGKRNIILNIREIWKSSYLLDLAFTRTDFTFYVVLVKSNLDLLFN